MRPIFRANGIQWCCVLVHRVALQEHRYKAINKRSRFRLRYWKTTSRIVKSPYTFKIYNMNSIQFTSDESELLVNLEVLFIWLLLMKSYKTLDSILLGSTCWRHIYTCWIFFRNVYGVHVCVYVFRFSPDTHESFLHRNWWNWVWSHAHVFARQNHIIARVDHSQFCFIYSLKTVSTARYLPTGPVLP